MRKSRRQNWGNLVVGLILIAIGVIFLLDQFLERRLMDVIWPFFIVIPGLILFSVVFARGKGVTSGLAIPASILTVLGLLLFYQNITGHWESWAYAWSLIIPISLGIGLFIAGSKLDSDTQRSAGLSMIKVGVWIFVVGGVFFEMIVGISNLYYIKILWPSIIILLGMYLVLRQAGLLGSKKPESVQINGGPVPDEFTAEEHTQDDDEGASST
jgi:hypothetical protein